MITTITRRRSRRAFLQGAGALLLGTAPVGRLRAAERALLPDVLVVIPGIMGSVLQKDGRDVWASSGSAMLRALRGSNAIVSALALHGDDPDAEDVGDGIVATRLMPDIHLLPGFWKIDGYTRLTEALQTAFDLRPGENYFEFAYDWRRDNRAAAGRLARQSNAWLKRWRERSGNAHAKLAILAHSMGGLVARHFVECLEGWRTTRRLVTFGTPFRGSLNALNTLANGFAAAGLKLDSFTTLGRTYTSLYQLLPQYVCYDPGGGVLTRVGEVKGIPNIDAKQAEDALNWHREMDRCAAKNRENPQYLRDYRLHAIVGSYQKTFQAARLVAGGRVEMLTVYPGFDAPPDGDGTVPEISAVPPEMATDDAVYISQLHASIQNTPPILEHVTKILASRDISGIRGARLAESGRLSLEVKDVYRSSEPVALTARHAGSPQELNVTVQDASTRLVVRRASMERTGDENYRTTLRPLPEGTYRISVGAASYSVADVFEVWRP